MPQQTSSALSVAFTTRRPPVVLWHSVATPAGKALLGLTEDGAICRLSFLCSRPQATILAEWKAEWPTTKFTKETAQHAASVLALNKEHSILLVGTPFQHRVWAALLDIPAGKTCTYGELAARIGSPKASRAVGHALGANPVPLLIPCHRVLAANGIGGFSGGLTLKRLLLESVG